MDVKDFYFDLPQELIAQDPLERPFFFQTFSSGQENRKDPAQDL